MTNKNDTSQTLLTAIGGGNSPKYLGGGTPFPQMISGQGRMVIQ